MERTDQELLADAQRGDDRALATLLERHAPTIHRFGMKMCRDAEDANDVLQETLLAAARGLREFRGASSLSTWLYTIARSFCIKKRRTRKGEPAHAISLDDDAAAKAESCEPRPDEVAAEHELGAALDRALRSLDAESREIVVLRDVEGLTAPEVAEVLGVSVAAVKSRLHRARAELRSKLAPILPSDAAPPSAPCPDVVALFSRYVEGEIGPEECAAMEQHVAACKRCGAACDSLKRTLALCRAKPPGDVSPEVQELVRKALREFARATPQ
jgi:RNA polymerase sigma-70 factor (ECF subfamily)